MKSLSAFNGLLGKLRRLRFAQADYDYTTSEITEEEVENRYETKLAVRAAVCVFILMIRAMMMIDP